MTEQVEYEYENEAEQLAAYETAVELWESKLVNGLARLENRIGRTLTDGELDTLYDQAVTEPEPNPEKAYDELLGDVDMSDDGQRTDLMAAYMDDHRRASEEGRAELYEPKENDPGTDT